MIGPNTYMHAVAGKGWPYDHKAEDTFDIPTIVGSRETPDPITGLTLPTENREYRAEFNAMGQALLVLDKTTTIGKFDTFADAQLAAEALNNHSGY